MDERNFVKKHEELFIERIRGKEKGNSIDQICSEEYGALSKHLELSKFQASSSVRNTLLTRLLSKILVNDKGELSEKGLEEAIESIRRHLFSLGPGRQGDDPKNKRILAVLEELQAKPYLRALLRRVDKPESNKNADQLVRDTLGLGKNVPVTHVEARRAVLSAYLSTLRQSVGSCFATAPAILVHREQPELFFQDMIDLLSLGYLKRTFEGEEFTAPLSTSWGAGDLRRPVPVSKDLVEGTPIWNSPGLINALQVIGVLQEELPGEEKRNAIKQMILEVFKSPDFPPGRFSITAEELLQGMLLDHHKVSHADVEEYLSRPHEMVHSNLLMSVPKGKFGKAGIGDRCNQFLVDFEIACYAFKSLADNALLKAWEFTLATFAETKSNFSKWNLYISLGMSAKDRGGIGERLYHILQEKLERENRKIEEFNAQYEQVYTQLKFMEGRLRRASEQEGRWLRSEYQSRVNEFQTLEELRNKAHFRAESFANLFDVLTAHYLRLFPKYFQEVYDADMHHVTGALYDDSPAGFQLIYKFGRASSAAWVPVKSLQEYVSVLTSFFTTTEHEIRTDPVYAGFQDDISEIVSAIVGHIKTEEFLETAFFRMAAHKNAPVPKKPLENLDKVEKKPWAYTSGGNLLSLLWCYFKGREEPIEKERWIERPIELLVFLVDTLKEEPAPIRQLYEENGEKYMLMVSPTHAFNLMPGYPLIREAWKSEVYTYTYCRDALVAPREKFVKDLSLDGEAIRLLFGKIKELLPPTTHHFFDRAVAAHPMRLTPKGFKEFVLSAMAVSSELADAMKYYLTPDDFDSFLYRNLPLTPAYKVKEVLEKVVPAEVREKKERPEGLPSLCTAEEVRDFAKGWIASAFDSTSAPVPYFSELDLALQREKIAMPAPILFADTNWVVSRFGFVVSPGTEELELWRLNETGTEGTPMSIWREHLHSPKKSETWGIYPNPHEYLFQLSQPNRQR